MCKKKFAGTGLGSCISWILKSVLLKSAITCLIKSKHFQQVKRESNEVKRFRHQPCPQNCTYESPYPQSSLEHLAGSSSNGALHKVLAWLLRPHAACHCTTHTKINTRCGAKSLNQLSKSEKIQQHQGRGVVRLKSEPSRGSHVLDNYVSGKRLKRVLWLLQEENF